MLSMLQQHYADSLSFKKLLTHSLHAAAGQPSTTRCTTTLLPLEAAETLASKSRSICQVFLSLLSNDLP